MISRSLSVLVIKERTSNFNFLFSTDKQLKKGILPVYQNYSGGWFLSLFFSRSFELWV